MCDKVYVMLLLIFVIAVIDSEIGELITILGFTILLLMLLLLLGFLRTKIVTVMMILTWIRTRIMMILLISLPLRLIITY